jgi:hypothetical protein
MNEQIQQLALQATDTIEVVNPDTGITHNREFFDKEKFAQLIVRECVGIVESLPPGYRDYRDQIEDAFRIACVVEIKHRFGVKK